MQQAGAPPTPPILKRAKKTMAEAQKPRALEASSLFISTSMLSFNHDNAPASQLSQVSAHSPEDRRKEGEHEERIVNNEERER
jgi:hypothetical protein